MAQVKLKEEQELWEPAGVEHSVVREFKEEPECSEIQSLEDVRSDCHSVKEEPEEVEIKAEPLPQFLHVSVKSEEGEPQSSLLHQTATEGNREDTGSSDTDDSEDWAPSAKRPAPQTQSELKEQLHGPAHSNSGSKAKRHTCSDCGKSYQTVYRLRIHELSHTAERSFKCVICEKGFRAKRNLKEHMSTHTEPSREPPAKAKAASPTQDDDERRARLEQLFDSLESDFNNEDYWIVDDFHVDAEDGSERDETSAPQNEEESESEDIAAENAPIQKELAQSCGIKCKKQCNKNITKVVRQHILERYKIMTYNEKKKFILHRVTQHKPKRISTVATSRRNRSLTYTLNNSNGQPQEVCKTFFLTTLGYHPKNDRLIVTVMKNSTPTTLTEPQERRGRHAPANKLDTAPIHEHIESFYPNISQYRREQAPNRRYLPRDITIRSMHEDYIKTKNSKCSYEAYRKVVKAKNISFTKLGKEECEACMKQKCSHVTT